MSVQHRSSWQELWPSKRLQSSRRRDADLLRQRCHSEDGGRLSKENQILNGPQCQSPRAANSKLEESAKSGLNCSARILAAVDHTESGIAFVTERGDSKLEESDKGYFETVQSWINSLTNPITESRILFGSGRLAASAWSSMIFGISWLMMGSMYPVRSYAAKLFAKKGFARNGARMSSAD